MANENIKICSMCKESKCLIDFDRNLSNKSSGLKAECKKCSRKRWIIWSQKKQAKAGGKCKRCPNERQPTNKLCVKCASMKEIGRLSLKEIRRTNGLCVRCGSDNLTNGHNKCDKCAIRDRTTNRIHMRNFKKQTFEAYGGKCVCCNESDIRFLSLDHVNGDGNKHRRELKQTNQGGGGYTVYRWARDNKYPDTLQILCHNCNLGRQVNGGTCPHKDGYNG